MRSMLACVLSFVVTVIAGRILIPWLRSLKAGQEIREDGPTWHNTKAGTPTMGGLMFILGIAVSIAAVGWGEMRHHRLTHFYIFAYS